MKYIISIILFSFLGFYSFSQNDELMNHYPEIDVIESFGPSRGYFFISSEEIYEDTDSNYIAIFDMYGVPVFYKLLNEKVRNFKLQSNGVLTYISGNPAKVYMLDSSCNYIDTLHLDNYKINDANFILTEDNQAVVLAYKEVEKDMSLIVEGGNPEAIIRETYILILNDNNEIIFEWNSSDHFNILDVNEDSPYVDLKSDSIDYLNASDLILESDTSILLCSKYMDEVTKIDIRNGNVIWRLGGANNEFTIIDDNDDGFSHPTKIAKKENGNILIFDSGLLHKNPVSSVKEYIVSEENKTATLIEIYQDYSKKNVDSFAGFHYDDKNIIAYWGNKTPSLTEFHSNSTIALRLNFSNQSFANQISKYQWKTNLFTPVVDSINFGMWDYTVYRYLLFLENNTDDTVKITSASNHSEAFYLETEFPVEIYPHSSNDIMVSYFPEMITTSFIQDVLTINVDTENHRIAQQVKLVGYRDDFIDPEIKTFPKDGDINIPLDTMIIVDFNEPIRFVDSTEITNENVSELFRLKTDDENGEDVVFYSNVSTAKDIIKIVPVNSLLPDQEYYFEMVNSVVDYYNNIADGFDIRFQTQSVNNVDRFNFNLKIYPNPAKENVVIESKKQLIKKIKLFDINGKLKLIQNNIYTNQHSININAFVNGLYFIEIELVSGEKKVSKILKN